MDLHIDWLSWTEKEKVEPRDDAELYHAGKRALERVDKELAHVFYDGTGFERGKGRPPYRLALARDDHGAMVYGRSHTGTLLFELSGRGCEPLRAKNMARWFVAGIAERITRIDFAVDVRCSTAPSAFANARNSARFRSISYIASDTGETVYLGSPKSDRFARVYRYREPHPRHHLLRVEFVFRRGLAKDAAFQFARSERDEDFTAQLGNTWGLEHSDWKPGVSTDERLRAPIVMREDADTVAWLYKQVAPAMARLLGNGALDMTDFLQAVYAKAKLPE